MSHETRRTLWWIRRKLLMRSPHPDIRAGVENLERAITKLYGACEVDGFALWSEGTDQSLYLARGVEEDRGAPVAGSLGESQEAGRTGDHAKGGEQP